MIKLLRAAVHIDVTCGFVLHGLGVDLDGKGLVTGWTAAISPGSYYVATSSTDQQLSSGYATLSCTDRVFAFVLYSAYAKDGTGLNIALSFGFSDSSCSAANGAWMTADQQGSSQLAFAIANNTTQTQTYDVRFYDTQNSIDATVTVPAQTSVAKFLTEILPASSNRVGGVEISRANDPESPFGPGFSVMALRYTGAAFRTIPVTCWFC